MRTLAAPTLTAMGQGAVTLVQLIHLGFPGGAVALNTSTWDLEWEGVTYKGAYGLGQISPIEDAPGEVRGLQFSLAGVAASSIALALDEADEWQGVPVTIRTAILNADRQITEAPVDWLGYGDTMTLQEDGQTAAINATAESSAVDLLRGHPLTTSHADQQSLYPGDRAFEYVTDQADEPVIWPSRQWFYK